MTNYFFRCLFSDNRFKLQLILCLSLLFFIDVNAQDLTVPGAVSAESGLSVLSLSIFIVRPVSRIAIDLESNHNLHWETSNPILEFAYFELIKQDAVAKARLNSSLDHRNQQNNNNA